MRTSGDHTTAGRRDGAGRWGWRGISLVLLVLCACSPKQRRTPDDTLVVVIGAVIRDIDPRFTGDEYDVKLSRLVAPGLTTSDTLDLQPALLLAESVQAIEPLRWRVTVRPGLRFPDGSLLTAEDVAYSYQSVLDPGLKSPLRKVFEDRFERVEALDERRVDFFLRKPLGTLLSDLDFGIVQKSAALAGGGTFRDGRVIGAGAYRVSSFHPEKVVLERNPHYWGPPAPLDRIEIRAVRDGNARNLMLVGGSADFTQNGVRVDLVDFIAKRPRIKTVSQPSAILTYLMMHNEDPLLRDVRVRRAIALAIDRQRLIEAKFGGHAMLATGLLPPFHWAYEGNVRRYDFDPDEARRLLDEAGYPDPDGPGGKPRLTLSYKTSADDFRVAVAEVIAAQLGEVGIEVKVRSFERGTFISDLKAGNFQLASAQTSAITEPDYFYAYFHSSRIPSKAEPNTLNRWHYRNARMDEVTARGRETMERDQRAVLYREAQQVLAEDLPIVPLWHEDNVAIMNTTVEGFEVLPNARFSGLAGVYKK